MPNYGQSGAYQTEATGSNVRPVSPFAWSITLYGYNGQTLVATENNPLGCTCGYSIQYESSQYLRSFAGDILWSYPDDWHNLEIYDWFGHHPEQFYEGGVPYIPRLELQLFWSSYGYQWKTNPFVVSGPVIGWPSGTTAPVSGEYDNERTSILLDAHNVHISNNLYDSPYASRGPVTIYIPAEISKSGFGYEAGYQTDLPQNFEINWGNGSNQTTGVVAAQNGIQSVYKMDVAPEQMLSETGEFIKIRARAATGSLSATLPVRVRPQAIIVPPEPETAIWDASQSYGRTGIPNEWLWRFSDENGFFSEDFSGETVEFDPDSDYSGSAETLQVQLTVNDSLGAYHISTFEYELAIEEQIGALHNRAGELFTAGKNGTGVTIYRFSDGAASRGALATIANAKNPSLYWRNEAASKLEMRLMVQQGENWNVRSSHDSGRSFGMAVNVWSAPYKGAVGCGTRNGDVSAARNGQNVYFRRATGDSWTDAPVFVGTIPTGSNKALQIRQKLNSLTLEITNSYDRVWRSQDMGRTWTAI